MAEFFHNKYVIKLESGHPGYRTYTIIATQENMAKLVQELSQALAKAEKGEPSTPQMSPGLTTLWDEYATIAFGETSRVSLRFAIAPDVEAFHVRPKLIRDVIFYVGCLGLFVLLILAFFGVQALIH